MGNKKRKIILPIRMPPITIVPIRPMKIPAKGEKIPISKIGLGKIQKKSIEISEGVVAYFDILGFSNKKDVKDIELTLMDFYGPLAFSATKYKKVRFNVFSDCAFIATSKENAADLLSAVRLSFAEWIADGILVRGGIALGTYREVHSIAHDIAPTNLIGNSFSGSAVVEAVKLEGLGPGALLFSSEECAEFYRKKYDEPTFLLEGHKIVGWSDKGSTLYWFVGISLLRLLRFLSLEDGAKYSVAKYLLNNIEYSLAATDGPLPRLSVLGILSLPTVAPEVREKALDLLKIKDPDDFVPLRKYIDVWLSDKKHIKLLEFLANSDSSIPQS